ncbi:MAG: glycoside hydrolase [Muribaculaceae bacterium]|nr:glycoside hydrolase [Muribaculaceae bacterium]
MFKKALSTISDFCAQARRSVYTATLLALAALCTQKAQAARIPGLDHPAVEARAMLFSGGDGVSKFYRIPALATLRDGTLVAVADRRLDSNEDLPGRIDVVCRTSADGGRSWSDAVDVVVNDEGGGYGDPALGIDSISGDLVCVMTHGNGLWQSVPGDHAYINVCRSSDGGRTWSKPVDITPGLFSQTEGAAPATAITAFASSGRILTCADGTMWFVLVTRPNMNEIVELACYPCRSTDGGHTWEAMPVAVDTYGDEAKMLELPGGELLMSIRNRDKGMRKFARSSDGGRTWTAPEPSGTLHDPAINGDIIALPSGRLIHSLCYSKNRRTNVSLFYSDNLGDTWQRFMEICPSGSAYSALTLLPDNRLGVLTEENSSLGGFRLWYTRINLDKLF